MLFIGFRNVFFVAFSSRRPADAAARQDPAHQKTSRVRTSSRSRRMRVPRSRSFIFRARRNARATAWVSKGLTISAPAASCGAAPANSESTSAPRGLAAQYSLAIRCMPALSGVTRATSAAR